MVCQNCNKREAVIHVTENWAGSSVCSETNLCADCAKSFHDLEGTVNLDAVFNRTPCRYCGGEPYIGGPDPVSLLRRSHRISMMCKLCSDEYYRFLNKKWPGLGEVAITDEQIANIRRSDTPAVLTEAEEHMKSWVAARNSK